MSDIIKSVFIDKLLYNENNKNIIKNIYERNKVIVCDILNGRNLVKNRLAILIPSNG